MHDRSRREVKPSADRAKRANALEQLLAAKRGGGARARTKEYEAKQEARVFEQLAEEDYAKYMAEKDGGMCRSVSSRPSEGRELALRFEYPPAVGP